MNKILAAVLGLIVDSFVRPALELSKVRAALRNVETLRTLRRAVLALCGVTACVVMMAGGAILVPLALCLFMPWDASTRLWVALAFAGVYLAIPIVAAGMALSERRWIYFFHVDQLLKDVVPKR